MKIGGINECRMWHRGFLRRTYSLWFPHDTTRGRLGQTPVRLVWTMPLVATILGERTSTHHSYAAAQAGSRATPARSRLGTGHFFGGPPASREASSLSVAAMPRRT